MPNEIVVTVDPNKAFRKVNGFDENKAGEFLEVVRRAYQDQPAPADLEELRKWLGDYPGLWRVVFDMAEVVQVNLIRRALSDEAAQIALEGNVASIRDELGYEDAPVLERLLIENIVTSWLRIQWVEYELVTFMGTGEMTMSVVEFWERRLSASQRRYLLACQTLAKIRRLASRYPNLQVNIATQNGQQVNVAGDLNR